MNVPTRDSPVYEFLRDLQPPVLPDEAYRNLLTVIEEQGDRLGDYIDNGKGALKRDDFAGAIENFSLARKNMTRKRQSQTTPPDKVSCILCTE